MQVLYGLYDLFDPHYLSDPAVAHVVPLSMLEWYRSPKGQWFHDELASGLLSKSALDSHDPQVQRDAARAGSVVCVPELHFS